MLTEHECSDPSVNPGEVDPGGATYPPVERLVATGERQRKSVPFAELKARLERETER
jgi:hypothetical protein